MKTCTNCGETKPHTEFNRNARLPDGYHSHCKACVRAYYQRNKDRILERHRVNRNGHATKKCSMCEEEKYLSEFHKDSSRADGHRHYCKECGKADQQNRKTTRRVSPARGPARRAPAPPARIELMEQIRARLQARKVAVARLVEIAGALIDNAEPLGSQEMAIAKEDYADLREALVQVEQLMEQATYA